MASVRRNSAALKSSTTFIAGTFLITASVGGLAFFGLRPPAPKPIQPPGPDAYSGSIVISSPNAEECQHYRLDNTTGSIKYSGKNDCTESNQSRGDRVNAISSGFRNK